VSALTGTALGRAALALTVADVLHALDHTRQGRDLAGEVYVVGVAGWIALAVMLVLIARRHPLAAPYAAAVGVSVAVGFLLVHVAPHWSAFSDPYSAFDPDALSWALVVLPIAAALLLLVHALRAMRAERPPATAARQSYV
jgi:ammonia channel protein AmtB